MSWNLRSRKDVCASGQAFADFLDALRPEGAEKFEAELSGRA
jgi:hypothetical protein